MKDKPNTMRPKVVDFTDRHFVFFKWYKSQGGNPSQLIRIALDEKIAAIEGEEKKIANYNNLTK